jgi:light-harvesting protein B-800-850 alpha chain
MNQGRIWCVVHPTVGLPLFLGSVAVTSLIVHASVLTHVDWFGTYWEGGYKKVSMNTEPTSPVSKSNAAFTMTVAPVGATASAPASFVITVTPNAAAASTSVASAQAPAAPVRTASNN